MLSRKFSDFLEKLATADTDYLLVHDGNGVKKISTATFKADLLSLINGKAASSHEHDDRYYTENELDLVLALLAPINSPEFTGTPKGVTPSVGDNSVKLATTEFVLKHLFYASSGLGNNNAGFHNSIYRGKNLGTSVSAAQYTQIAAGTFDDMFIGDYWVINNVTWRIAAFDYWYRAGDSECTTHHVVIVPDSNLANCKMNNENITTGAYIGSDYYTGNNSNTGKATAKTAIEGAFGAAHILTHKEYLKNAVTNGYESAGSWYDSTFELMTEQMVYGGKVFANQSAGTSIPAGYTVGKSQLPLFAMNPYMISNRLTFWLRDVVSASFFAIVINNGYCAYLNAGYSRGVRPAFAIKS